MLNLYKYYKGPTQLPGYQERTKLIPKLAYRHAMQIGERWPEAEPHIIKDPWYSKLYAAYIIKGRWPEAEPIIITQPITAVGYARDVIRGRWPEAEPYIMKNPRVALRYAMEVIEGRWKEAEPYIKQSQSSWTSYLDFIKGTN